MDTIKFVNASEIHYRKNRNSKNSTRGAGFMYWIEEDGEFINMSYFDINGRPVRRTPNKYPYSYDPYVIYKHDAYTPSEDIHTVYSDRMWEWDHEKFNESHQKVWNKTGHYFANSSSSELEKFIQLYYNNNEIELMAVLQGCNHSNGNQYWVFYFKGDVK